MNRLFLFALLLGLAACRTNSTESENSSSPFMDPEIRRIYELGNDRNTHELLPYSKSTIPSQRMAFARVMASVQDTSGIEALSKLARDPIPYVRLYAVYALGQYRDTLALGPLEKAIKKATIPEIKAEALEAIGKCSNRRSMEYLLFHEPSTEIEETGKMRGLYQGMLQGELKEVDLRLVVAHLKSGNKDTRLAAAHILGRQGDYDLSPYASQLKEAIEDEDSGEVRAVLVRSVKGMSGLHKMLLNMAERDSDPRARAAALKAIGSIADPDLILNCLEDGSVWVAMTASAFIPSLDYETYSDQLKSIARISAVPQVRASILTFVLSNEEEAESFWSEMMSLDKNEVEASAIISSLHNYPLSLDSLLEHLSNLGPKGSAAAEALINGASKYPDWEQALPLAAELCFERGLTAQSFHFAYAFAEGKFREAGLQNIGAMQEGLSIMTGASAIETRNEIRRALSTLSMTPYEPEIPSEIKDIDFNLITELPENVLAKIYTKAGAFKIALLKNDAPATVGNFVSLAQAESYDGTHFHRIVPVFVSQGGGNRGDGFGGPDYTIRSEFAPLQYGEGIIGMASAGKDTEGSQFFITHISTPHLDGRYTIFAALIEGFDLLDEVHSGMKIDSIRIVE